MPARSSTPARPAGSYRVEALAKGLRVLNTFADAGPLLTLSEIAEMTELPMPTAFRLAATLEEAGYIERMPNGAYRPALKVLALGQASLRGSDLVEISSPPSGARRHDGPYGQPGNAYRRTRPLPGKTPKRRPRYGQHSRWVNIACRVQLTGQGHSRLLDTAGA